LKLEDIHPHWRFVKPSRQATGQRQDEEQEENYTSGDDNDVAMDIEGTPPSPPFDLLHIQEPAIVKPKGQPPGALNKVWAGAL